MSAISSYASSATAKSSITNTMANNKYESILNNVPKNLYKAFNRWLILPEINTDADRQAVAAKIEGLAKKKGEGFKGDFIPTTKFGEHAKGDKISFTLLDPKTPVGQIKKEISKLTNIPEEEISISFFSMRKLNDHTTFSEDLSCHGKGGERFWISRNTASALAPEVKDAEADC